MEAKDCVIGTEVYTEDGINYRYIVTSVPGQDGTVQVKPANKSSGEMDSFHHDDLYLYDLKEIKKIAAKFQAKVDNATNAFELAFKALKELHEVEYKSNISHFDLQESGLLNVKELEITIEEGGWSSSSLWC